MNGKRLSNDQWRIIFTNLSDNDEEVEVLWLDSLDNVDEWALCCDTELFEDGFTSEKEALDRLNELYTLQDQNEKGNQP